MMSRRVKLALLLALVMLLLATTCCQDDMFGDELGRTITEDTMTQTFHPLQTIEAEVAATAQAVATGEAD